MEGVHCDTKQNIVFICRRLEYVSSFILFLIGGILGVSMEHVGLMFPAEREHVCFSLVALLFSKK
jgi:hypothetical protein